jgi:hypothetical protein
MIYRFALAYMRETMNLRRAQAAQHRQPQAHQQTQDSLDERQ